MGGERGKERKKERGGMGGGRERKQGSGIVAYIVIALGMMGIFLSLKEFPTEGLSL